MFKLFYDWLVVPPADLIAYLVLVPISCAPLVATVAAWVYTVDVLDDTKTGRPKRLKTYFVAGMIAAYVFLVTVTALVRLPHAYYELNRDTD